MAHELAGIGMAIATADGVERVEPEEPGGAHGPLTLIEAGAVKALREVPKPPVEEELGR